MRWLRKLGTDLSQGRNLEVYLTILVALTVTILSAFNIVQVEVISAVTLATLALLAFSTLNSRDQISALQAQVRALAASIEENVSGRIRAENFFLTEKPKYEFEFQGAKSIMITGATLSRTLREYFGVFERRLRDGASLQFVILDPKSDAIKQAVLRSYGVKGEDFYQNRIKPTVDLLQVLASLPDLRGTIELRLLPYMPSFGLTLTDPDDADGIIYVDIYQHKSVEGNPTFMLHPRRDEKWYPFFRQQFDVLWNSARAVDASDVY